MLSLKNVPLIGLLTKYVVLRLRVNNVICSAFSVVLSSKETGRGGRNGLHTEAILYNKSSIGLHVSEQMKDYCRNTIKCRREVLFEDFDDTSLYSSHQALMCTCCDLCELKCTCKECNME